MALIELLILLERMKNLKDCLIIDFGTATTFDIINSSCVYEGGVIAPGIKLSLKNLSVLLLLPFINLIYLILNLVQSLL